MSQEIIDAMLEKGLSHTSRLVVAHGDTAEAMGSGDMPVLATPRMMALMENAAMLAVAPALAPGETTVGGHIESSHVSPTPVGATVTATATLTGIEGRKLHLDIEAHQETPQGPKLIGRGHHLRFIVDRGKFMNQHVFMGVSGS